MPSALQSGGGPQWPGVDRPGPDRPGLDRPGALARVAAAYLAALVVALGVHRFFRGHHPLVALAAADLAGTLVVFGFSRAFDNSSFYDPYWSVAPLMIAPALAFHHAAPGVPWGRPLLVVALIYVWGLRLTWNWIRSWRGLSHEDWRYVDLRQKTGRAYWLVSLLGLHLLPTAWVFAGCLPLWPALSTGTAPIGPLDALALAVTAGSVAVEAIADEQLWAFRLANPGSGRIFDGGLWAYSRHPNYVGEIGFWWGLFLFGLAADGDAVWTVIGPLGITALFVFISVPMIDRRSLARRPGYAAHMQKVPALLPWPWRRPGGAPDDRR